MIIPQDINIIFICFLVSYFFLCWCDFDLGLFIYYDIEIDYLLDSYCCYKG